MSDVEGMSDFAGTSQDVWTFFLAIILYPIYAPFFVIKDWITGRPK